GRALAESPLDLYAAAERGLQVALAPRPAAIAAGLGLAGALLGGALRVAYLAGALPTLGRRIGADAGPAFATGMTFRFPRVLGAALLGLFAQVAALLFASTLAVATVLVSIGASGSAHPLLLAGAGALAL